MIFGPLNKIWNSGRIEYTSGTPKGDGARIWDNGDSTIGDNGHTLTMVAMVAVVEGALDHILKAKNLVMTVVMVV